MAMVCSAVLMRVAGRRVHDDDAQPRGGPRIDIVGADAGPHDRFEPVVAFQGIGRDLHAAAADGAVELGQRRAQGIPLQSGADFVFDARRGLAAWPDLRARWCREQ